MNKRQAKKDFKKHVRVWTPRFDTVGMPIGKDNREMHYKLIKEFNNQ